MDPVGFVLATPSGELGFLTDLGHVTRLILERVRRSRWLVLEANHDLKLLQDDLRRPWGTKQRILSRHGHLSNEAAADVAVQLAAGGELQRIYLGHLSRDCNRPDLALNAVARKLQSAGARHIEVHNTSQDSPSPTLDLEPAAPRGPHSADNGATMCSDGLPESSVIPPAVRS
jgi:phosphoribosyl 1,2-cyclic phosphodiesterase